MKERLGAYFSCRVIVVLLSPSIASSLRNDFTAILGCDRYFDDILSCKVYFDALLCCCFSRFTAILSVVVQDREFLSSQGINRQEGPDGI